MKKTIVLFGSLTLSTISFGQTDPEKYFELCKKADSLYNAGDFKNSAYTYSAAFKANGWRGSINDRYNAACSWALANIPDSAFFYLHRAIFVGGFTSYKHMSTDSDLTTLHKDKRWKPLLEKVKENKEKAEANLNKPLVQRLDSILQEDQEGRNEIDAVASKYGWESKEVQALWKSIGEKDSINLIKVTAILDKYGWLGPDVVGQEGNTTLFLVIQHSDQKTQEKYLPMMREAVKNNKASGSSLALLEDRVALGQGKKQIYGSQIGRDPKTDQHYVLPLEDPDNVDKRRAEVGLGHLNDYVSHWQIKWDVEAYKKAAAETAKDTSRKISVSVDNYGMLSWRTKNESSKKVFVIEQYRWGKWIKIGEVDGLGNSKSNEYGFQTIPHSGENQVRVTWGNDPDFSGTVKWTSNSPPIKFGVQKKDGEIKFSNSTLYEIIDSTGTLVKKGYGESVSIENLPKGKYILNFDSQTNEFKK
jgi:hypothetical protein